MNRSSNYTPHIDTKQSMKKETIRPTKKGECLYCDKLGACTMGNNCIYQDNLRFCGLPGGSE